MFFNKKFESLNKWWKVLLFLILGIGLTYLLVWICTWLICYGFGIEFNRRMVIGVYAIYLLINSLKVSITIKEQ